MTYKSKKYKIIGNQLICSEINQKILMIIKDAVIMKQEVK
jgi:hypothetical protein